MTIADQRETQKLFQAALNGIACVHGTNRESVNTYTQYTPAVDWNGGGTKKLEAHILENERGRQRPLP